MNQNSDSIYGYSSISREKKGIQDGEIIDILFLDEIYANLKRHIESEDKRKEECNSIGLPYEPKEPTFKELGLCWKYAIIKRSKGESNPDNYEKVFRQDDNGFPIEPNYICYGQINEYPPEFLYNKNYNYQMYGGSTKVNKKNGMPIIIELLPNVWKEKDWKENIRVDEIPKGSEIKFKNLIEREKKRIESWNNVIKIFNSLTETDAYNVLNQSMSSRFLNCFLADSVDQTNSSDIQYFDYLPIQKGTLLTCIYRYDGKYSSIHAFEKLKGGKIEIYSKCNASMPSQINIETADNLIKCREINKKRRMEQKENQDEE